MVGISFPPFLVNSLMERLVSVWATMRLTAGCDTNSSLAAALIEPVSMTARKTSIWRNLNFIWGPCPRGRAARFCIFCVCTIGTPVFFVAAIAAIVEYNTMLWPPCKLAYLARKRQGYISRTPTGSRSDEKNMSANGSRREDWEECDSC